MAFALVALGLIVVAQFVLGIAVLSGMANGPPALLVGAILGAMVWVGLSLRHRWAHIVTISLCPLNLFLAAILTPRNVIVSMLLNGIVFVPVLMSTSWFWGGETSRAASPRERLPR